VLPEAVGEVGGDGPVGGDDELLQRSGRARGEAVEGPALSGCRRILRAYGNLHEAWGLERTSVHPA
jgi:hypothetical protein